MPAELADGLGVESLRWVWANRKGAPIDSPPNLPRSSGALLPDDDAGLTTLHWVLRASRGPGGLGGQARNILWVALSVSSFSCSRARQNSGPDNTGPDGTHLPEEGSLVRSSNANHTFHARERANVTIMQKTSWQPREGSRQRLSSAGSGRGASNK